MTVTPRFKRDMGQHAADRGRARSASYLALIRQLPCFICWRHAPSEAAHVRLSNAELGIFTGGQLKPDDALALPLCARHHREGADAEHVVGTKAFWRNRAIDPLRLALRLKAEADKHDTGHLKLAAMLNIVTRVHFLGEPI